VSVFLPSEPSTEEAAGTSRSPGDLLVAGHGYQNIITTDRVDDPILTDNNIRYFKKISKEMYNFTLVRHDDFSTIIRCRVACLNLSPYAGCDQALAIEIRKTEGSREWPPGARCKGKMHIRRADKEHISSERARQAEAGVDVRNVVPQERSPQP
jgi:hypothetical protein